MCKSIIITTLAIVFLAGLAHAQSLSDLDMTAFQLQKEKYEIKSRTDPFAKGQSAAEDLSVEDLELTGIAYRDEDHAYALISGYLVRPGDRVAGFKVDRIEKDRVTLRRMDEVIALVLGGGI